MHPDKGGDPAQFQDLQKVYETLMDPQMRAAYDKYGEDGMGKGPGGGSPEDFFGTMFG